MKGRLSKEYVWLEGFVKKPKNEQDVEVDTHTNVYEIIYPS